MDASSKTPTFGTDGVRGVANSELTVELSLALGRAAARELSPGGGRFLVGRDTRRSGPLLQAALSAGLAAEGVEVVDLGVLPTPAIAVHSATTGRPAAVISASHNPFADNGIKLFAGGGKKLDDDAEHRIAAEMNAFMSGQLGSATPNGAGVGSVSVDLQAPELYVNHIVKNAGESLAGLTVALDCANGAASFVAPRILRELGANVIVINDSPDGLNINHECGSTHPAGLQELVRSGHADVGLALDGDADRMIAVDEAGNVVDGDHVIAMLALDAKERGELAGATVVVTVMTNLGFRRAMDAAGVHVHETKVGDRYVAEALEDNGWSLGGEQSGHIIFPSIATTGDGLLSGIKVLNLMHRSRRPLSELAGSAMTRLPQVLRNVRVARRGVEASAGVQDAVANEVEALGDSGRVLLRASGTEPLVRVMVEAETQELAEATCERLCEAVRVAAEASA